MRKLFANNACIVIGVCVWNLKLLVPELKRGRGGVTVLV
jgi:hypothetical protein